MSSSSKLISHPDRTLAEHLDRCNEISEKLLEMKHISDSFFSKEKLQYWRKLLCYFHDCGKATDFFQARIIDAALDKAIQPFLDSNREYINDFRKSKYHNAKRLIAENSQYTPHARLGAYLALCNPVDTDKVIETIIQKVILGHHGNQTDFLKANNEYLLWLSEERIANLTVQLNYFDFEQFNNIIERHGFSVSARQWEELKQRFSKLRFQAQLEREVRTANTSKYFFLHNLLYSLLLSADKGDVMLVKEAAISTYIRENTPFPNNLIDNYKQQVFSNEAVKPIDIEREEAYHRIAHNCKQFAGQNFFSITLPTGLGKTLSAYNAAVHLQQSSKAQTGQTPRIIYCLPFTSIIDQNTQIISDIFRCAGIEESLISKHHYLSGQNDTYDKNELTWASAEYMVEGWEHDFVVTTFVQLLESIFTNKNRSLRKFHNMLNSIIILDEVQNIPPKYYKAIEHIFTAMAEYFNTKFIFVTATQPIIFSAIPVLELTGPGLSDTRRFFENRERIVLDQSLLKQSNYKAVEIEELIEQFKTDIAGNSDKSFLLICNTISDSRKVFEALCPEEDEETHSTQVLYLSGSILPRRRQQLIALIKRNQKHNRRQIIVSTQVVEAGVDIDLDIVYRDFAPLDSINQSAGRCNRNGIKGKGIVKLFCSGKDRYIYDPTLLNATRQILSGFPEIIEENQFFDLNQRYFREVYAKISEFSDAATQIIEMVNNLNLESLAEKFKLIDEPLIYYNVFIPYNRSADKIWRQYMLCFNIPDVFERKKAINMLKPSLLQYVTRFPKKHFTPDDRQAESQIIRLDNWAEFYSLSSGFIPPSTAHITIIL